MTLRGFSSDIFSMKHYCLIMNPCAGNRDQEKKLAAVRRFFSEAGDSLTVLTTERPGHAAELARSAASQNFDAVIAAGGDGTLNEVVNGLAGSKIPLGILPWGTGNVFAEEMRLPKSIRKLCLTIRKGHTASLDTGIAGFGGQSRRFLLMASAGFDAYSLKLLNSKFKRFFGVFSYVIGGLSAFASYRFPTLRATLPEGENFTGTYALVSNTRRYGLFFSITPQANPADGILDGFVSGKQGHIGLIGLLIWVVKSAFRKNHRPPGKIDKSARFRAPSVVLESARPIALQLDGDYAGELPARISIDPASLRVLLPRRKWKDLVKDIK